MKLQACQLINNRVIKKETTPQKARKRKPSSELPFAFFFQRKGWVYWDWYSIHARTTKSQGREKKETSRYQRAKQTTEKSAKAKPPVSFPARCDISPSCNPSHWPPEDVRICVVRCYVFVFPDKIKKQKMELSHILSFSLFLPQSLGQASQISSMALSPFLSDLISSLLSREFWLLQQT